MPLCLCCAKNIEDMTILQVKYSKTLQTLDFNPEFCFCKEMSSPLQGKKYHNQNLHNLSQCYKSIFHLYTLLRIRKIRTLCIQRLSFYDRNY